MSVNSLLIVISVTSVGMVFTYKPDFYFGCTVHDVALRDASHQRLLYDLQRTLDLDIWRHGVPTLREAQVMVSPDKRDAFLRELDEKGVAHSLRVADVAKALKEFDMSHTQFRFRSKHEKLQPFEDYMRYAEVNKYLEQMAVKHPNIVTVTNAGVSFEGRDIKYLKISTTNFTDRTKPVYFMTALQHAREWVGLPAALYSVHRLVENLKDADKDLLEGVDWIIMPIANPDGYEFTHTDRRLWRRTRSVRRNISKKCFGVDANRNFDISFNTLGVSNDPCSDNYPGPTAFSESETEAIKNILHKYANRIQVYLDLHSHGNYVLYPFGNYTLPRNKKQVEVVARTMVEQMNAVKLYDEVNYLFGNIATLMYPSSGSASDYAQHLGIPLSFTVELPGLGGEFLVPPRRLPHVVSQTWRAIAASARLANTNYKQRMTKLRDHRNLSIRHKHRKGVRGNYRQINTLLLPLALLETLE